jgi:SanA protein
LLLANKRIAFATRKKTTSNISKVEHRHAALVLGTSKYLKRGWVNQYYKNRIEAAVELYQAGKVDYIIVSGDNGRKSYNEPRMMYLDLVNHGVPSEKIVLDYAGFRTFDSVVRCKRVFGQESIVVVSQRFHNERAVFIAQQFGIDAIGYNAQSVNIRYGLRTKVREFFARVKVFIDLLFKNQPKHLGPRVKVG